MKYPCTYLRNKIKFLIFSILAIFLCILTSLPVTGETGITETKIILAQSCDLSGPIQYIGNSYKDGALLYFNHVNDTGGINGRKIVLKSKDDQYNADRCYQNTETFVNDFNVFSLFGYVGTPTSDKVLPLITEKEMIYFAPYTGAEFLRWPLNKYVFNVRSSYFNETDKIIKKITGELGFTRFSVYYHDNSFGKTGLQGVENSLSEQGLTLVSKIAYTPDALETEKTASAFIKDKPEAIVIVGVLDPTEKIIREIRKRSKKSGFNPFISCLSVVGGASLAANLMNDGIGVTVAQVTPYPYNKRLPVVNEYINLMRTNKPDSDPDFISMEGYIAAKVFCDIIRKTPEPVTRQGFIQTAEKIKTFDQNGFTATYSPDSRVGSEDVYFTQICPGGYITPVEDFANAYEYQPTYQ